MRQTTFRLGRIEAARQSRCKAILALTQTACDLAQQRFRALGRSDLAAKLSVFRGGVPSFAAPRARDEWRPEQRPLRVIFVGRHSASKGLVPVLSALEKLRAGGLPVKLTLIGELTSEDYVLRHCAPRPDMLRHQVLDKDWIEYHPRLPNPEVRQRMSEQDVLLFPSLDESLGWVVVEAGLAGIPAVVTNVFALPELVRDGETGAVIELPLGASRRWTGIWSPDVELGDHLAEAHSRIEDGITRALQGFARQPGRLEALARGAYARMLGFYEPVAAGRTLAGIYARALDG
jgi:glycosyltransferase involved in cell wall biosynthesis